MRLSLSMICSALILFSSLCGYGEVRPVGIAPSKAVGRSDEMPRAIGWVPVSLGDIERQLSNRGKLKPQVPSSIQPQGLFESPRAATVPGHQ